MGAIMNRGHNGGPPLTEADVPDLTYVKFYPADFLTGTMHLSLEQRGAYITALCVMYDRMSGFPYDEKEGASLLRVDKRVYRRVRDDLLADGKFYRDGDVIRNRRVEDEIRTYIAEYLRRSVAAKEREAKRKLHRASGELVPNLAPTLPELRPEVSKKCAELDAKNITKTKDPTPQADHIPEARSQKPEARKEEVAAAVPRTAALPRSNLKALQDQLLEACNGALDNPVNCVGLLNLSIPEMWIDQGADLERDILPTLRAIGQRDHGKRIRTWAYFTNAVAQAKATRQAGMPEAQPRKTRTPMGSDWSEIAKKAREQEGRQ
jgi:uncharacterized protein YdaU (DUF1376 family)